MGIPENFFRDYFVCAAILFRVLVADFREQDAPEHSSVYWTFSQSVTPLEHYYPGTFSEWSETLIHGQHDTGAQGTLALWDGGFPLNTARLPTRPCNVW
ncbi:MAG: hypothetical protein QG577_466 [Thermodesulfobacteriota bacterium]|nr:hypothetical protein [Thermodesulfobacteriota bacterium]